MSIDRATNQRPAVAIIPVRAGSKGVPSKNLRPLRGKPLLAYTVEAALSAKHLAYSVVSTDGEEIADCARSLGIAAILHPSGLSADDAPTFPAIRWALGHLVDQGHQFDLCVTMRATTPFRTGADIDAAMATLLARPDADSIVSVYELAGAHPRRLKTVDPEGWLEDAFMPEGDFPVRRQELEPVFIRNGGVYIATSETVERGALWGQRCLPYVMPAERSLNINTAWDFELAEMIASRSAP